MKAILSKELRALLTQKLVPVVLNKPMKVNGVVYVLRKIPVSFP